MQLDAMGVLSFNKIRVQDDAGKRSTNYVVGCFLSRKTAPGISKNELISELNKLSISSIRRLDLLQPSDEIIQEVANLITF